MPTVTKSKTAHEESARLDLATLEKLTDHPALAGLTQQRQALRQRLTVLEAQIFSARHELGTHDSTDLQGRVQSRATQGALKALEAEGATIEAELAALLPGLEAAEALARPEMVKLYEGLAVPVLEALGAALQTLHEATTAAKAFARQASRACGQSILPPSLLHNPDLSARQRLLAQRLERVRRGSTVGF